MTRKKNPTSEEVFEEYQKHGGFIHNLIARYKLNTIYRSYDDIQNISLIAIWKAFQDFNETRNCSFNTYVLNVITWDLLRESRKELGLTNGSVKYLKKTYGNLGTISRYMEEVNNQVYEESRIDKDIEIRNLVFKLSPNALHSEIMHYRFKGLTVSEISRIVEKGEGTVNNAILRLKRSIQLPKNRKIKEQLKEYFDIIS